MFGLWLAVPATHPHHGRRTGRWSCVVLVLTALTARVVLAESGVVVSTPPSRATTTTTITADDSSGAAAAVDIFSDPNAFIHFAFVHPCTEGNGDKTVDGKGARGPPAPTCPCLDDLFSLSVHAGTTQSHLTASLITPTLLRTSGVRFSPTGIAAARFLGLSIPLSSPAHLFSILHSLTFSVDQRERAGYCAGVAVP